MYHICFVILHYLSFDTTKICIESIRSTIPQTDHISYHIIIVDNASPNNSYVLLQEHFRQCPDIILLQANNNLGFAKGNNIGYRYALDKLHADFIIIANNDTEFTQPAFLEDMLQIYEQTSCALIGPDIFNAGGYHQNPYRTHTITRRELSHWIRNRRIWLIFLSMDNCLHLTSKISFFRKFYDRRAAAGRPDQSWMTEQADVVLHGACIVFTPLFTKSCPEYAFYPDTFLYCEEDILALLCTRKGLSICYNPKLQVVHKESVSTNLSHASQWEKDFFFTRNILKSLKILKKLWNQSF